MLNNSFGGGLLFGLLIAFVCMFLFNPVFVAASVLVLFLVRYSTHSRKYLRLHPNFLTFAQRGFLIIIITALIWVFHVNPAAALLGLTLPLVTASLYRKRK